MNINFAQVHVFVFYMLTQHIEASENGREVEGGVELLKTGPIQLIIPDVLAFTVKNVAQCQGGFAICYPYKPMSREQLLKYHNIGQGCPPDCCTLYMSMTGGVYGLASEMHDGNFYGMLMRDSRSMCPLHAYNVVSNLTVLMLPNCPVIVDGAKLPKDEVTTTISTVSNKAWIIPVCVVSVVLVLVVIIVILFLCIRSKRNKKLSNISPPNSVNNHQRTLKSPKSPAARHRKFSNSKQEKRKIGDSSLSQKANEPKSRIRPSSRPTTQPDILSNSETTNQDV